ncbi:hypothetical protein EIJ81_01070 (plasmid) [Aliivibrio salmonicida]|uniref:DNA replication terminus site-binding protein n=1 Tax=Aliivibrio salmonicida TaxID=40269 RepID=UPI000F717979|nr:DNA replication terminus site-binding protein [Aliivibrio salmonicida]AZL83491.1 hypothetical protein EIJ81_01070 [Aliivibrio salmonicida]
MKKNFRISLEMSIVDGIKDRYENLIKITDEMCELLMHSVEHAQVSRVQNFERNHNEFIDQVLVYPYSQSSAIAAGVNNFKVQNYGVESPNVPVRVCGTMVLTKNEEHCLELITRVNLAKQDMASFVSLEIQNNHGSEKRLDYLRTKYYRTALPVIKTATIYRQINVAPLSSSAISLSWCASQFVSESISESDVNNLIHNQDHLYCDDGTILMHKNDKIGCDYRALGSYLKSPHLVRLKPVRVHPVQSIYYKDHNGVTRRKVLKATSPLLILLDTYKSAKIKTLPNFNSKETEVHVSKGNRKKSKFHPILPKLGIYIMVSH